MSSNGIAPVPQDAGLWNSIVENLPRDPAAVVVLVLVLAAVIGVWLANRKPE